MANAKDIKKDSPIKALFYGPSGTGKTRMAAQFPNAHFVDLDKGLRTIRGADVNYVSIDKGEITDPDFINNVPNGKKFAEAKIHPFVKSQKLMEYWANTLTKDDTLILDSFTMFSDYAIDYAVKMSDNKSDTGQPRIQDWGYARRLLEQTLELLITIDANLIVIAHEQFVQDEESGAIDWTPLTIGALRTKIANYFDEVYYFTAKEGIGQKQGQTEYILRTRPCKKRVAKSRDDLPFEIVDPSYDKLMQLMKDCE